MKQFNFGELIRLPLDKSVYLIHGGETFQTLEATIVIRNKLKELGFTERKSLELNSIFTLEQLIIPTQNLNLFSTKQLLELTIKEDKIDSKSAQHLIQFIINLPKDIRILIIANKLASNTQKTKWFTFIQQTGCIIIAKPIPEERFPFWIINRLKYANFTAATEVIAILTRLYFGNLVALAQLIEKLTMCLPAGELSLEQITPYLQDNADFNVFNLIDSAIDGDNKAIYQIFTNLKATKTEPIIILWAIAREIRILIKVAFDLEQGNLYSKIYKKYGIWISRSDKIQKYLNKTSRQKLEAILQRLTSIDAIIKGTQFGLVWGSLLTVYLQFADPKRAEAFENLSI
jgi:DNA polymerase-3 subunit delta